MSRVASLVLAAMLAPAAASALTVQDVVALSKAGVSESVMLAMIERDRTIFALDAAQVIALKRDGVSERVVMALLKSGREEPAAAPVAVVSTTSAPLFPTEPLVVGVGNGPDLPNTFHDFEALGGLILPVTTPWLFPPSIPFVYSGPFSAGRWQRSSPACAPGPYTVSGSRVAADARTCRRPR